MDIVKTPVDIVSPKQVAVITVDQPQYSITKRIHWAWPATHEGHFIVLFGGLHIGMAALKVLGNLLDSSGWTGPLLTSQSRRQYVRPFSDIVIDEAHEPRKEGEAVSMTENPSAQAVTQPQYARRQPLPLVAIVTRLRQLCGPDSEDEDTTLCRVAHARKQAERAADESVKMLPG